MLCYVYVTIMRITGKGDKQSNYSVLYKFPLIRKMKYKSTATGSVRFGVREESKVVEIP